jgi:hypothetical protein
MFWLNAQMAVDLACAAGIERRATTLVARLLDEGSRMGGLPRNKADRVLAVARMIASSSK